MSTVKISELPVITHLSSNTSNTLFVGVDIPSGVTGKIDATTLAHGLYSNNNLIVGNNNIVFPNTIAQFTGNSAIYLQVNQQNFTSTGSGDYVITADTGTNANSYIDLGLNNSGYSDTDFSSMGAYDGYLYVQGPSTGSSQGNLVIGTASANANISVMVGGTKSENVALKFTKTGLTFSNTKYLTFGDGTTLSTSPAAMGVYANGAFVQANAAFLVANTPTHVANSAAIYANGAFTQANSAYAKANNALANTTGTFAGDLTVTGNVTTLGTGNTTVSGTLAVSRNLTVNGTLVMSNSNFLATESAVTIKATANVATPSNDGYMLHISGKQNVSSRIVFDSYSITGNAYGLVAGRTARGTVDAPLAAANGDVLMRISGNGYGTTGFAPLGIARIDIIATENYTDAARGSRIEFYNIANGSNTLSKIASFNANSVTFTGQIEPQKGFVYTPRLPVGAQTAITINYSTDSMVKANLSADLTVSHSNFVAGKIVEVWLVNTGAQNRTITHGLSAINSTTKSTTFTITASSCAYMRFFSIDGDLANTFVTVTA